MKKRTVKTDKRSSCQLLIILLAFVILFLSSSAFFALEKNAIFYNKQGWEYIKRGENVKAVLQFKNAIKKNPNYKEAVIGLGTAYVRNEAYSDALDLFNRALKLDKKNTVALAGKGFAMTGMGRYGEAIRFFEAALKISGENLEAHYGIAHIYYLMDRTIWAKRKIKNIFRINPYHYYSLILMADIKADEKRLDEAKRFIEKAVAVNAELPVSYVRYGKILLREYTRYRSEDYLNDAVDEFTKAIAIQPENFRANRYMGYISLVRSKYDEAVAYYKKSALANPKSGAAIYGLSLALEGAGNMEESHRFFSLALKMTPSDNLLQTRFEDHLVMRDYKIGHPSRIGQSRYHLETAKRKMKKKLFARSMLHLRRSLYLNPMQREAREHLIDYYNTLDYFRFYVDEIKAMLNIYPENRYRDRLRVAVYKRRERLYNKAGYAIEMPVRDVPRILVMDFLPEGEITAHYDAGKVVGDYLSFVLRQFGRMQTVGIKKRNEILQGLPRSEEYLEKTMEHVENMLKQEIPHQIDYLLFGDYREGMNYLSVHFELMNVHNGVVISDFELSERGRENLSLLALRAARKIFKAIPYRGSVLKVTDDSVIVNLGSFDGVAPGDLFAIRKYKAQPSAKLNSKHKILLRTEEADTIVSSMKPLRGKLLDSLDVGDEVYPLKKRRAQLVE